MPLQATSGAASYDAFGGGVAAVPTYIEDVFSTYLYTGNGPSSQTITNGIDLAGKGGLVWFKRRDSGSPFVHELVDTVQGKGKFLSSDSTSGWGGVASDITSFNANGFSINDNTGLANNGSMSSWTFRKQPKFFDVVTYTGNGTNGRTVAHSLGSTPACIIVKRTDASNGWAVYHRAMNASPQDYMMRLNATDGAFTTTPSRWNNTLPTSTEFTLSGNDEVNGSGATYVAYLFAHDAGGFGLTGTDNVISCGSYTGNGSTTGPVVTLGYEPQWLMVKRTDDVDDWNIADNMRGLFVGDTSTTANSPRLRPNLSNAEQASGWVIPTATGFQLQGPNAASGSYNASGGKYIYIAIRRGPMKVPTSGTSVFSPIAVNNATGTANTTGFPVDLSIFKERTNASGDVWDFDRLRGVSSTTSESGASLKTNSTSAEGTTGLTRSWNNTGFQTNSSFNSVSMAYWNFRRAPSFFDEVCYTGDGNTGYRFVNHNLGVVPELVIVKRRDTTGNWTLTAAAKYLILNTTAAATNPNNTAGGTAFGWDSTQFATYGLDGATNVDDVNATGSTYVAYLFATCAGVSKVGSYTGNGSSQTINCGFTGGARFILIKRTDNAGNWMVWDTARGITTGNDPVLALNATWAEDTLNDDVDPASVGFIVNNAGNSMNANGATYIYLAIA